MRKVLLSTFVLLGAVVLSACSSASAEDLHGTYRDPALDVSTLTGLTEASTGQVDYPLKAEPGKLMVSFFGFTYCPDICPTTLSEVRTALRDLSEEEQDRIEVSMVTIDPERDTGPVLQDYLDKFVDDGIALRAEDQTKLQEITKTFGAAYEVAEHDAGATDYQVGHSAWLYAIDDQGQLRLQWSYGTPAAEISEDLKTLLQLIDAEERA